VPLEIFDNFYFYSCLFREKSTITFRLGTAMQTWSSELAEPLESHQAGERIKLNSEAAQETLMERAHSIHQVRGLASSHVAWSQCPFGVAVIFIEHGPPSILTLVLISLAHCVSNYDSRNGKVMSTQSKGLLKTASRSLASNPFIKIRTVPSNDWQMDS
jgi:hypothetical protein